MTSYPQYTTRPTLPNIPPPHIINLPGLRNGSRRNHSQPGVEYASGSHTSRSRQDVRTNNVSDWEKKFLNPVVGNPNFLPQPPWQAKANEPKSSTTMDLILANAAAKSRDPAAHAFFPRRPERYWAGFGPQWAPVGPVSSQLQGTRFANY